MKSFFPLVAVVVLLAGCARHYVITLTNGNQVTAIGKPQLQEGRYIFTDARGEPGVVSASRVREISPQSMTGGDSAFVKPTPAK